MQERELEIKRVIKKRYNYLDDEDIERCYSYAVNDYISYKYSFNHDINRDTLNITDRAYNWIIARCEDILSRAGGINVTAYKENGINLTYGASYIDPQLLAQIIGKVGIPK